MSGSRSSRSANPQPCLLPAAQAGDGPLVIHRAQAEPSENRRSALFAVIAAQSFEASERRVIRGQRGVARVVRQSRPGLSQRTLGLDPLPLRGSDRISDGQRLHTP